MAQRDDTTYPFAAYNNGTLNITVECGRGFSVVLPPGASVELSRLAAARRLDDELSRYMSADPRREPARACSPARSPPRRDDPTLGCEAMLAPIGNGDDAQPHWGHDDE
jgi:hypothetical protein